MDAGGQLTNAAEPFLKFPSTPKPLANGAADGEVVWS